MDSSAHARARLGSAAIFFSVLLTAAAAPEFTIPPSPLDAQPGDLHAFYGQVKAVDRSARTITIGLPMLFTFKVTAETQITVRRGAAAEFNAIRPGSGVQIVARRGANSWTAQKITLEPGATFPEEISAKTVQGKTITGPAVAEFIVYEPPTEMMNRNINFGQRSGLFLVSVLPDGTVGTATPIKSLGVKELDERAIRRLMKMKFRPGALTEARIPVDFRSVRRY